MYAHICLCDTYLGVMLAICMGLVWGRYMYQREVGSDSSLTYSLLPSNMDGNGAGGGNEGQPHATGGFTSNAMHSGAGGSKQSGGLSNTLIYDDAPGVVSTRSSGSLKL